MSVLLQLKSLSCYFFVHYIIYVKKIVVVVVVVVVIVKAPKIGSTKDR